MLLQKALAKKCGCSGRRIWHNVLHLFMILRKSTSTFHRPLPSTFPQANCIHFSQAAYVSPFRRPVTSTSDWQGMSSFRREGSNAAALCVQAFSCASLSHPILRTSCSECGNADTSLESCPGRPFLCHYPFSSVSVDETGLNFSSCWQS